ncbi:hypothetical protein C0J52_19840 [Blattella germanica]|nr:hypothetical protein C0J52_19840 [Blattella germanica]
MTELQEIIMKVTLNWFPMILMFHERYCDIMDARAGIIKTLHERFHIGCIAILIGDDKGISEEKEILELEKSLFELHSRVHTLRLTSENNRQELDDFECHNERAPLIVILEKQFINKWIAKVFLKLQNPCRLMWLLFLSDDICLEEEFSSIYVPFNCKFMISQLRNNTFYITEIYRINLEMPVFTYPFGFWRTDNTWRLANNALYGRRDSLEGLTMKGVSIENPPFTKIKTTKEGQIYVSGYIGRVWALLEEITIFRVAPQHGSFTKGNKSWTGLMEMLRTNETPLDDQFLWTNFLRPFSKSLWLMVTASIFVFSIVFHFINIADCHFGKKGSRRHNFFSFLYHFVGVFCLQGQNMQLFSNSSRIVYITSYFTAMILLAAYSSSVISSLATKNEGPLHYRSIHDLLDSGDPKTKKIFISLVKPHLENLPTSEEEGFARACSKRYAHVSVSATASAMSLRCKVTSLPDEGFPISKAIGLVKNSPYKDILNYKIFSSMFCVRVKQYKIKEASIPFSSEFLIAQEIGVNRFTLKEVYHVNSCLPQNVQTFAQWTPTYGLIWQNKGLYQRRSNLKNVVINVGINVFFGSFELIQTQLKQYIYDFKYKTKTSIILNNSWGVLLDNGTWTGMIGMVHRNEVEVGIGAFSMTSSRTNAVNFFVPLLNVKSSVYFRATDGEGILSDNVFIKPFRLQVWIAMLTVITLLATGLSTTYNIGRRIGNEEKYVPPVYKLLDSLFYVFTSFCQQGMQTKNIVAIFLTVFIVYKNNNAVILSKYH